MPEVRLVEGETQTPKRPFLLLSSEGAAKSSLREVTFLHAPGVGRSRGPWAGFHLPSCAPGPWPSLAGR